MLTEVDRLNYASRMLAFIGDIAGAERLLTEALEKKPQDVVSLRQRGHRRITLRRYEDAVADLQLAAELMYDIPDEHEFYQRDVVPDLVALVRDDLSSVRPQHIEVNEETIAAHRGMYKSTLRSSVWYHLGIAKYMLGAFEEALDSFTRSAEVGTGDDSLVATFDWRYMILRRLGREAEAQELLNEFDTSSLQVTGGEEFYLRRLELYKGEKEAAQVLEELAKSPLALATQGYGVANWYLYNGDAASAKPILEDIVSHGEPNSFAYMAAEIEINRLRDGELVASS